jgi:hypothetical protein
MLDAAADRDEAAERALRAGGAGVEQDAVTGGAGVDALDDGGRGVAALEGDGLDQQVRERVQHHVGDAGEDRLVEATRGLPRVEARRGAGRRGPGRAGAAATHGWPRCRTRGTRPRRGSRRRGPMWARATGRPADVEAELAVDVGHDGFEAGEADLGDDLAELVARARPALEAAGEDGSGARAGRGCGRGSRRPSSSRDTSGGQASRVSISATLIFLVGSSRDLRRSISAQIVGALRGRRGRGDLGLVLAAQIDQVVEVVDVLELVLPDLVDGLAHRLVGLGQGDDAEDLGEVGVAGRADEQAAPLGLVAVAVALHCSRALRPSQGRSPRQRPRTRLSGSLAWPSGAAAPVRLAADVDLAEVAAGAALVDPQAARAARAVAVVRRSGASRCR